MDIHHSQLHAMNLFRCFFDMIIEIVELEFVVIIDVLLRIVLWICVRLFLSQTPCIL